MGKLAPETPHTRLSLITFIVSHPRIIILCVLLVTLLFSAGFLRGLMLDVSPMGFIEKHSRELTDFEATRRNFGDDLYLVIGIVSDDVFAPASLARLRALHQRIEKLDGVAEIISLINVPYARSIPGGASLEKLIPEAAEQAAPPGLDASSATQESSLDSSLRARLIEARNVATSDRLFIGHLVSRDGRATAINVLLKSALPASARHVATRQIYDLARNAGFNQVFFAGDPFSQWRAIEAIKHDLKVFLPLTLLLTAVLLWLCFRSLVAVVLPLLSVGIGLTWLFGLMAIIGGRFTILALMLPTLLLAIGCSYIIHVLNQVGIVGCGAAETEADKFDASSRIHQALRFITVPVIVSALTIIAGFLSLTLTAIPVVKETAVYAALGAFFTLILSLTFVPAVLVMLGEHAHKAATLKVGLDGKMVRLLESVGHFATAHQLWLYIVTGLIVVFSFVGTRRIQVDIDYFHFFRPNSETSISVAEIGRRLAGAVYFDVVIEGQRAGMIEDPTVLARIAELQTFAESGGKGMDHTLSVVDFLKHVNRAFHSNDPQFYTIPDQRAVIQELLSDREQIKNFITDDGHSARILVRSTLSGSRAMSKALDELEARGQALLPGFRVFVTGTFVLMNRTSDRIAYDQLGSITIALLTIYAMLALLFRSWRVGITALVPNLIPVLFFFGFMGWRGIPLNLTTSLVASVVLGLAVDNAVQFICRFRSVQPEVHTLRQAIIQSLRLSGRPIIYANVALAASFAIFAFSHFVPISDFGVLSAVTILGCLVEDLVLLPARLTSRVFRATGVTTPLGQYRER